MYFTIQKVGVARLEGLLISYKGSLRSVNKARFKATRDDDRRILGECASSLRFTIEYMELGKLPGNRRAITNRSKEQRTIPVDPNNYAFIKRAMLARKVDGEGLSDEQQKLLDDLLATLTSREREAFVMVRGSGYSYSQAAELLGIAKGTVQDSVERAERKMRIVVTKGKNSGEITVNKPVQCVMFA